MYPELKQNDFHLTGESYAGKYLPLFAYLHFGIQQGDTRLPDKL